MATIPLLLFFFFILINSIPFPSFSCPLHHKQALLNSKSNYNTIFNLTIFNLNQSDYYYPFNSWSPNSDCCSWDLVVCSETGNVTQLHFYDIMPLFDNPASVFFDIFTPLFHIQSLEQLDISLNRLVGEIPGDGFENLTQLVHLNMAENNFNGSIPYQIFGLTNLRYLYMSYNSFGGNLGPELGKLQNLESLDLTNNSLTGNIPEEIGNLKDLEYVNFSDNFFSGGIPCSIANMKDLEYVDFSRNSFSKEIPTCIGRMPNITTLFLNSNQLTGPIPSSIQNLSRLEFLSLQDNNLTGEIPTSIFNITTLRDFSVGGKGSKLIWNNKAKLISKSSLRSLSMPSCGISGQIPEWISSNTALGYLDLSGNKLEGPFPNWLAEMDLNTIILFDNRLTGSIPQHLFGAGKLLSILHLSQNNFSGKLPENIGNATGMTYLMLSENNFSGQIPMSMSNMDNLILLDLSINKFSGHNFPDLINASSLIYLDLSNNEFSGKIPTTFSTTIEFIYLGGNEFSGHLPWNLTKFVSLQHLDLHDNNITGYFQDVLPQSPYLRVLVLRNNFFEGFIPTTISNFSNLQILDLSGNNLSGSIPLEITNLTSMIEAPVHMSTSGFLYITFAYNGGNQMYFDIEDLVVNWKNNFQGLSSHSLDMYSLLDLSNNKISGEIPASLGNLKSLKVLNISNNNISGHIPLSFGNLKGMESLDLSHNKISGSIPKSLEKLDGLGILDVSNNRLTGKIPMGGHMSTMNGLRYFANNSGLCGMQINITCPEDILPPLEGREEDEDDENLSWIFWVGTWIGFPIGFFSSILIMGYFLNFLLLFKKTPNLQNLRSAVVFLAERNWNNHNVPHEGHHMETTRGFTAKKLCITDSWYRRLKTFGSYRRHWKKRRKIVSKWNHHKAVNKQAQSILHGLPIFVVRGIPDSLNGCGYWGVPAQAEFVEPQQTTMATIPLFLFFFLLLNSVSIPSFSCPLHHKLALLSFKSNITTIFNLNLSDYYHPFKSWSPNSDCCTWNGVHCSETGTVTELYLSYIMPSYDNPALVFFDIFTPLFHIRSVEHLDISSNNFVGEIPGDGFGNLTQLVDFDLSFNSFNGSIPYQIFGLTNLRYLDMSYNSFEGNLGPELGKLQNLESLDLTNNSLTGNIPEEIGYLKDLRRVDFSNNFFSGGIPDSIGNMKDLRHVDFSNNFFSGGIPDSIGNMKGLEELDFSRNSFSMKIPTSIGRLPNMTRLTLNHNQLTGPIPSSIQNLSRLKYLSLQDNNLTGEIPIGIFNITTLKSFSVGGKGSKLIWKNKAKIISKGSLRSLSMPSCGISGQIPEWISSNTALGYLDLSGNKLEGPFPNWLAKMRLDSIILFDNKLSGSIPQHLFESTMLRVLHLSQNNFFGELPEDIGNATSMRYLMLSGNNFFGQIPMSISNMDCLKLLDLSINKFYGHYFPDLSNASSLIYLDLSNNEFSGKIPTTFSTTIEFLYLGGNEFSGHFPGDLTKLASLQHLDLHDNNITGCFQDVLPQSPYLRVLVLRNNSFEGFIPTTISNFSNLQILDLSGNNLSGSIPLEIANLTSMIEAPVHMSTSGSIANNVFDYTRPREMHFDIEDLIVNWKSNFQGLSSHSLDMYSLLDLSNNKISGEIPASLGNLKSLKVLNISNNNISGHIPVSFGKLKGIESLDLSHNKISGSIPQSLENLDGLGVLDVSNNRLTGKIPMGGHMSTMDEFKYFANNSGLCGMQINITCPESYIPPSKGREEDEDDEQLSWIFWVGTWIGFPIGFFSSILIMGYFLNFLLLFKRKIDRINKRERASSNGWSMYDINREIFDNDK
ncbi:hypothetical protein OSB04_010401 [Centaurea solstitialis]|uniref:Leucine-rich repeat-containing N-terminal plant-type domain-containing protein n=1 Tax=Centaurea solstitialis TaxID=347529 RepID=A0AA38WBX3_9ASTR|nr:hypothetical protein OSB04_010401 [Centaurea solstitialis]